MTDVGRHPKVELLSYSEVKQVTGYVGNFKVKVHRKARFVVESECTACGDCVEVCPVTKPNEFEIGLATRKAIYTPFPQAVPPAYVINIEDCLGHMPLACEKCAQACEKHCINYDMEDEDIELDVGVIIVAIGMKVFDPTVLTEYGYTKYANVITSMEFERLINSGGPSEGHFIRLDNHEQPKRVAFLQCIGSRSEKKGRPYCSNVCCMNTIKDTILIKEHYPEMDLGVYYIDIRAFGKGFEDLFKRSKSLGVRYMRGLPGEIRLNEDGMLDLYVENVETGKTEKHPYDMVILSVGLEPLDNLDDVRQMLNLSKTSDGFLLEAHPKLQPVDAPTRGIYFAGCAEAPKDIKDSVTQASGAVARAGGLMSKGEITVEAITSRIIEEKCKMCGICAKVCPYNAIIFDKASKQPPKVVEAACAGCGTCGAECPFDAIQMRHFTDDQIIAQIDAMLEENPMDKVVVFACNWCSYAGADLAGTSRFQQPSSPRLIRTMCSGRVDKKFILHAFKKGAPIVLVSGCHFGDCHYIDANHWTKKRVDKLREQLVKWGIRGERLPLYWISAAEGQRFQMVMNEMEELRKTVTVEEVEETKRILAEQEAKEAKKKAKKTDKEATAAAD
jgi:heterodisulfide reductase subunit A